MSGQIVAGEMVNLPIIYQQNEMRKNLANCNYLPSTETVSNKNNLSLSFPIPDGKYYIFKDFCEHFISSVYEHKDEIKDTNSLIK